MLAHDIKKISFLSPRLPLQTRDLQSEVVSTVGLLAADFWMPWRGRGEVMINIAEAELSSWKHILGQHLDSTWNCAKFLPKVSPKNLGFCSAGMQFTNISKLAKNRKTIDPKVPS